MSARGGAGHCVLKGTFFPNNSRNHLEFGGQFYGHAVTLCVA